MYKTERLELRLTPREVEMLDQVRGPATRSAWIRRQILTAAQHQYVIPSNVHPLPVPGPNTHSTEEL